MASGKAFRIYLSEKIRLTRAALHYISTGFHSKSGYPPGVGWSRWYRQWFLRICRLLTQTSDLCIWWIKQTGGTILSQDTTYEDICLLSGGSETTTDLRNHYIISPPPPLLKTFWWHFEENKLSSAVEEGEKMWSSGQWLHNAHFLDAHLQPDLQRGREPLTGTLTISASFAF